MGSTLQGTQNSFFFMVSPSKTYNYRSCILVSQVLCVEDGEFKPYPTSLALPAKAGPHTVILLGIPQSVGPLKITGKYCTLYSRKCILLQKHTFIQVFLLLSFKTTFVNLISSVSLFPIPWLEREEATWEQHCCSAEKFHRRC